MSESDRRTSHTDRRNGRLVLVLCSIVVGMVGLTFAAVPLYDLFCRVTGYGGTTQVAERAPDAANAETIKVRFNADVNRRLPWSFKPEQREMVVRIGEPNLTVYHAENQASRPTVGTAIYNVTPFKAGPYFHKVQCFCFDEQKLEGGESVEMGVSFYIDPAILEDPEFEDMHTITLSYTFFRDLDDWDAEEAEEQVSHLVPMSNSLTQEQ
ncbi:cytochrome c oxidase assembly protein [Aquibaculum sediminis]|uniref:cytochrome c oxidase assembly protein n=1 Tax=Aquibaculum sediminis TaxID=3231907 RepID=UPI00345712FA